MLILSLLTHTDYMLTIFDYLKCFLLLLFFTGNVHAQTAPGGVSGQLGLWLKSSALDTPVVTVGGAATGTSNWADSSTNSNDAIYHPTDPSTSYYTVSEDINFTNCIRINDEWFDSPLDINQPNVNVFMVYKPITSNANRPLWGNGSAGVIGKQAYVDQVHDGTTYSPYTAANTIGKTYLNHISSIDGGVTDNSSVSINGDTISIYTTGSTLDPSVHAGIFIGKETENTVPVIPNNTLSIAEVVVYTGVITEPEREQINSYLALKYGINLAHNYTINSGNTPVWDRVVNSTYNNNVIGLAKDISSTLDVIKTKSEDNGALITLSTTGATPNNEALVIGHNNLSISATSSFNTDNFFIKGKRLNRVWKCQKTAGFSLPVNIAVNATTNTTDPNTNHNINLVLPVSDSFNSGNMVILVSDSANMESNLKAYPLTINTVSGTYEAMNVVLGDGQFFTIASLDVALWVKADAAENTTTAGAPYVYYDNVLGVNSMSSPDPLNNPTHVLGTDPKSINFNPCIQFNDNNSLLNQYISKNNLTGFGNTGLSAFMVLRRDDDNLSGTNFESIVSYASNGYTLSNPRNLTVSKDRPNLTDGHNSNKRITNSIPHVFTNLTGEGQNNEIRLDASGVSQVEKNSFTIASNEMLVFGQSVSNSTIGFDTSEAYQGDIAEAIIFNEKISNTDRNAIETYLGIKYGITLVNNYVLPDLSVLWDKNANLTYHHNVAGIGRADIFALDQRSSKSQNGANVDLTIKHTNPFNQDNSYLIWGCNAGVYDSLITTNAPIGYLISDKIWKVKNWNNRVSTPVNITLKIPPSLNGLGVNQFKLIINNNNSNFSTGAILYFASSSTPGLITFTNVSLEDNDFFSLVLEDSPASVVYSNSGNPTDSTSFEACVGDAVTFTYTNLTSHPNRLQLMGDLGAFNIVLDTTTNLTYMGGLGANGIITLTIPTNTKTGSVKFLDSSAVLPTVIHDFSSNLIIHKPAVDFILSKGLICATDSVPLIGIPSGGMFSTTPPSLIGGNSLLIGMNAGWSSTNDSIKVIPITYSYQPSYLNSALCSTPIAHLDSITIRDNRFTSLSFKPIIATDIILNIGDREELSSMVEIANPDFSSNYSYPIRFSGNYVNNVNGVDSFFADHAGFGSHPVTMQYDNGGCIGERTSDVDVLFPLQLSGLGDTLCNEASPLTFIRDTSSVTYFYTIDSTTSVDPQNPSGSILEIVELNIIDSISTLVYGHFAAITTVSTTPNFEEYTLDPQHSVFSGQTMVTIRMHYKSSRTIIQYIDNTGNVTRIDTLQSAPSIIEYPIRLVDRPSIVDFQLDPTYCKNAALDTLLPNPVFESPHTSFSYRHRVNSGTFSSIIPLPDDIFDAASIYNQGAGVTQNQDLEVELTYTVNRYGCVDTETKVTRIIRPVANSLLLDSQTNPSLNADYCKSTDSIQLTAQNQATASTPSGSGIFLVNGLRDTILIKNEHFFPMLAQSSNYNITYQFTETPNGCVSTSSVSTINVREPAEIELSIDGNSINPKICGNDTSALLQTQFISGNNLTGFTYAGTNLSILGDTLNPSATFDLSNATSNTIVLITATNTNTYNCVAYDDLSVEIYKPLPQISGFVNTTYCNNKSPFSIVATPSPTAGNTITGAGVVLNNGNYSYDPNMIFVDSVLMDTVRYAYTDGLGCSGITEKVIRIDSIPEVSLTGLDSNYCVNGGLDTLEGIPLSGGIFQYTGAGLNQQGLFSPTTAGTGIKNINYSFTDTHGCQNDTTQSTTIHARPIPQFTFPQTQYCANDAIVRLDTTSPMGAYTFWGSLIDSSYIINPQDTVGQQTTYYSLTDAFGCVGKDSTTIFIHPLPVITVTGLDSAYCSNSPISTILISPALTATSGSIVGSALGFNSGAAGVTFDPQLDTTSGVKLFKYTYTDNITSCTDSIELNTSVYAVPVLSTTGINSTYCNINHSNPIEGFPTGGVFSGAGISIDTAGQYYFNPFFSGGGNRILNYRIDAILYNSSSSLSCPVDIDIPIVVNQLPSLQFSGPGNNHRFCSNEADVMIGGSELTPTWRSFTSPSVGAIDRGVFFVVDSVNLTVTVDTSYTFSPNNAGPGVHYITYTGIDSLTGCQDTIPLIYHVTDYGNGASFLLDSAYCASNSSIALNGNPTGGTFSRNQTILVNPPYLDLNTSTPISDTIIYEVTYDACTASDTQLVDINPLVNLSFTGNKPSKTYCFGDTDSPLVPNVSGGTFNGAAVISGDALFSLQYATAGDNIISYTLVDSATACTSTFADTFFVYGMPNLDFKVIGGCQLDSIFFHPDNVLLGLNNTFGTDTVDSITSIVWELERGQLINGSSSNNKIDSIGHVFTNPGVYETMLQVTNKNHCTNSTNVRVVISPTIRNNQFPYDETFERSNGNWYAEAKDTSHGLLWEWGIDTIPRGINERNNKIWVTKLNDQYAANEAAWVYSPCFDISNLERPMIRFDHWSDSRNRGDGTVLEFQKTDGSWTPLGELDRGINWFNAGFIAGSPGNQTLSPIGWSGQMTGWANSRYKLDEFKNTPPSKLRLRMSFASSAINLGGFYNGFAFDNVWIGNRTRNVLLETTSNIYEPNMDYINNYVYQLAYHSNINKDVILLQYHSEAPNDNDQFHQYNRAISNARTLFYGIFDAGTAFIDGISNTKSKWLNDLSFEQNMLASPKFNVEIDTFYHNNPDQFTMTTTVTALVDIPTIKRYRINMVITEDSLSYSNGENVHAVVRKDYPSNSVNTFDKSWAIGEQMTLTYDYPATGLNYVPNRFQAVAFIQAQEINGREVFQAATTRDVSGYFVGVDPIASEQELNEIKDLTLYPNPAKDYINIDFPDLLEKDYNWKLISIGGITVKEDVIHAGEQSLKINNYDLPSGVYVFMVYNGNVYTQRKVIINQE